MKNQSHFQHQREVTHERLVPAQVRCSVDCQTPSSSSLCTCCVIRSLPGLPGIAWQLRSLAPIVPGSTCYVTLRLPPTWFQSTFPLFLLCFARDDAKHCFLAARTVLDCMTDDFHLPPFTCSFKLVHRKQRRQLLETKNIKVLNTISAPRRACIGKGKIPGARMERKEPKKVRTLENEIQ